MIQNGTEDHKTSNDKISPERRAVSMTQDTMRKTKKNNVEKKKLNLHLVNSDNSFFI